MGKGKRGGKYFDKLIKMKPITRHSKTDNEIWQELNKVKKVEGK